MTLSGAGIAAVDGVLLAAGGVDGMLLDGAGVVAGGVSFAGGVVCDHAGALSAMTIAADARSRDFIVASFAGDLSGAGPRQTWVGNPSRAHPRADGSPASAPLVKSWGGKSFPARLRQRVLKEAEILGFLWRIDLTVPVMIVTAPKAARSQDAPRRDEFRHQERLP
jgi:hypothetical protein